ncbi:hypothetical protein LTR62_007585 [Meristemomyces frigidus]|uniref:L-ornithine N(5)-monooxygenase [NAD(P)H] n=1 Tax=Meristemomyces frigidus TaxID=1508187 RepID=A0AAN7TBG8_9PEZI|nr:hypothetical protein LTR62_007585 [Meristemomyces frigidus]
MSPHATAFEEEEDHHGHTMQPPLQAGSTASTQPRSAPTTSPLLRHHPDDDLHDLICVGFGPASLAIAVALHDTLEQDQSHLHPQHPKIRFLEKQPHFAWHAGMLLPGAKMQISFVKDLATLRNPRSKFTFLNYLHQKGRLVAFTNLGTFLPQRIEYEDYMRWCAGHFDEVVEYGADVRAVEVGGICPVSGAVDEFRVSYHDNSTGRTRTLRTRHVVIAAGGKPNIPSSIPNHPRIIHSSQYATSISRLFPSSQPPPRSIAVLGAGQSAAEVFNHIPTLFPAAKTSLVIRGAALRPSDDSPFVNEIFDPDRVDDIYSQSSAVRAKEITRDRATNYSVVRLELLEHIYSTLYTYRIQFHNEQDWPQRILPHRTVTGIETCSLDENSRSALQLHLDNDSSVYKSGKPAINTEKEEEVLEVDLLVVATGYLRTTHETLLESLNALKPSGSNPWTVRRNYAVEFAQGKVSPQAGVWLQGCNESTHGLSDSLLSILASRAGEVVASIFGADPCNAQVEKR